MNEPSRDMMLCEIIRKIYAGRFGTLTEPEKALMERVLSGG